MPKKTKPEYNGVTYDSQEECEFVMWLDEAKQAGLIIGYLYHPKTFNLADAVKIEAETGTHRLSNVEYTPDFIVYLKDHKRFNELFKHGLKIYNGVNQGPLAHVDNVQVWVDVKGIPGFKKGQSANSSLATYPIKAAWVYQKYGIFINKVIARDMTVKDKETKIVKVTKRGFFSKTFVPEKCAWMKARKVRTRTKAFASCKLLSEVYNK